MEFWIPLKISYPYIERCIFDTGMKYPEFLDWRDCKHFWKGPMVIALKGIWIKLACKSHKKIPYHVHILCDVQLLLLYQVWAKVVFAACSCYDTGLSVYFGHLHWLPLPCRVSLRWSTGQGTRFCVFINTLRLRQNGRRFPDDSFKCIFLNENAQILIKKIPLKFVPRVWINTIPALVQMMAWCQSGTKPLSAPMMVILLTHIYAWLGLCELNLEISGTLWNHEILKSVVFPCIEMFKTWRFLN